MGNQVLNSIPTANINGYAESKAGAFEPRESTKGDLARSVFYFYTMYRAQANLADPNYFELQRPTLCQWAQQDPADSIELRKTWRIAPYQDGKPNPFVIDCTLASRCWCPGVPPHCLVGTISPYAPVEGAFRVWPNPASEMLFYQLETGTPATISLINLLGRTIITQQSTNGEGEFILAQVPPGVYIMEVAIKGERKRQKVVLQ